MPRPPDGETSSGSSVGLSSGLTGGPGEMPRPGAALAEAVPDGELQAGLDYTLDAQGRWVFTARHLKARGYCCFQACRHCPWGQAGRTRTGTFADLQVRLEYLEGRLRDAGLDIEVAGYRLGVVRLLAPRAACASDLDALAEAVRRTAEGTLTVVGVEWA